MYSIAGVGPHDRPKRLTLLINAIKNYCAPTAVDIVMLKHTSRFDRICHYKRETALANSETWQPASMQHEGPRVNRT
jgi:hypothetical protein